MIIGSTFDGVTDPPSAPAALALAAPATRSGSAEPEQASPLVSPPASPAVQSGGAPPPPAGCVY
ncbi:hypothetical protein AB1484_36335 [Parafrankia sp. FMc6]|uniref:hypothetical protein n=1 Tax=Parafrankia soli TaxID=2599596 RepID=UPI0034D39A7E